MENINQNLLNSWNDILRKEEYSKTRDWRSSLKGIQRNDIYLKRRELLLNIYPPFLEAAGKLLKKRDTTSLTDLERSNLDLIEKNWGVRFSPLVSTHREVSGFKFDYICHEQCIEVLDVDTLATHKTKFPNIVIELNPHASPIEIMRQIGEIVDDLSPKELISIKHKLEWGKHSEDVTTISYNFPHQKKEQIKHFLQQMDPDYDPPIPSHGETMKMSFEKIFGGKPMHADLELLHLYIQTNSFTETDAILISKDSGKKPDSSRIQKRISAICKYCEYYNEYKSEFYQKHVKK